MPGMSGDEVLEDVRERSADCKVAMVTAVEPDFDVITMGFDDYLIKPVEQETLLETIERLLSRSAYAELEQELYALVSKQAVIESSKSEEELADNEEFVELESRIAALRAELDDTLSEIENDEFVAMVRDLEGETDRTGANDDDERSGETEGGE
jgi:DNA-binding response OmpR family regulator